VAFTLCSSPVAGSLNPLLLSTKWMLAAFPHHRECTNLHQSAYLDQNRYRAQYPHHWKTMHREELYANEYIWLANWRFEKVELWKCFPLGQVVGRAVVESALESALWVSRVKVHLFLCISSVSADSARCHPSKEASRLFRFDEELPGVFVLQPSLCGHHETQHPASSLLWPRRVVT